MTSVLSVFRSKKLLFIQTLTSLKQASSLASGVISSSFMNRYCIVEYH